MEHKWGYANYPGDVTHMQGGTYGPDTTGRMFVVTHTEYDDTENKTKVEFDEVSGR